MNERYVRQVQLLVRVLPLIDTEKCFALKGGTAINLFYRELPRLSVDIDLLYIPRDDRETALVNIKAALGRISDLVCKSIKGSKVTKAFETTDSLRLLVMHQGATIKVELSPVIRGTIFPEIRMKLKSSVEKQYGYAEIQVASFSDLYAGKLCAALDRQHPRDLFDVKVLLENEGLTDELRKTFLVFLISHHRPMAELLRPNIKNIAAAYETEFAAMTENYFPLPELEQARDKLISTINTEMTRDERNFLMTFKSLAPDWNLLGLAPDVISSLPSVQWKLHNLKSMGKSKHVAAIDKLERVLFPR